MDLHGQIMNILADANKVGTDDVRLAYLHGHRDARHAAAEMASVDECARVAPLRARLEWLENALQHIAGSCEGRAADVAREALGKVTP